LSSPESREELYRKVAKLHAEVHCGYRYGVECDNCSVKAICDGFHGDYAEMFQTSEAKAVTDRMTDNPLQYVCFQKKVQQRQ
jgi:hypothetical protein